MSRADLGSLVLAALAVFLVAFSDSILTARSFAARHHEVVDANQELLAFGVAQIVGGRHAGHPGRDAAGRARRSTTTWVRPARSAGSPPPPRSPPSCCSSLAPIQYLPSAVLGAVIVYAGPS